MCFSFQIVAKLFSAKDLAKILIGVTTNFHHSMTARGVNIRATERGFRKKKSSHNGKAM